MARVLWLVGVFVLGVSCSKAPPPYAKLTFDLDDEALAQISNGSIRISVWPEGAVPTLDSPRQWYFERTAIERIPFTVMFVPAAMNGAEAFLMRAEISSRREFTGGEIENATQQDWIEFGAAGLQRQYLFSGACLARGEPCPSHQTCDETGQCIDLSGGPLFDCNEVCSRVASCGNWQETHWSACIVSCPAILTAEEAACIAASDCDAVFSCSANLNIGSGTCVGATNDVVFERRADYDWWAGETGSLVAAPGIGRTLDACPTTTNTYILNESGELYAHASEQQAGLVVNDLPFSLLGNATIAACDDGMAALARGSSVYYRLSPNGVTWQAATLPNGEPIVDLWIHQDSVYVLTPTSVYQSCVDEAGFQQLASTATSSPLTHGTQVAASSLIFVTSEDGSLMRVDRGGLSAIQAPPYMNLDPSEPAIRDFYSSPITDEDSLALRVLDSSGALWETRALVPQLSSDWTRIATDVLSGSLTNSGFDLIVRNQDIRTRNFLDAESVFESNTLLTSAVNSPELISPAWESIRATSERESVWLFGPRAFAMSITAGSPVVVPVPPRYDYLHIDLKNDDYVIRGQFGEMISGVGGMTCGGTIGAALFTSTGTLIFDAGDDIISLAGPECNGSTISLFDYPDSVTVTDIASYQEQIFVAGTTGEAMSPYVAIGTTAANDFVEATTTGLAGIPILVAGSSFVLVVNDIGATYAMLLPEAESWTSVTQPDLGPITGTAGSPKIRGITTDQAYVVNQGRLFTYTRGASSLTAVTGLPSPNNQALRDVVVDEEGNLEFLIYERAIYARLDDEFVQRGPALPSPENEPDLAWTEAARNLIALWVVGTEGMIVRLDAP